MQIKIPTYLTAYNPRSRRGRDGINHDVKAVFLAAALVFSLAAMAGCASRAAQTEPAKPAPADASPQAGGGLSPHTAQSGPSAGAPKDASSGADSKPSTGAMQDSASNSAPVQANLNRLFLERPGGEHLTGTAASPGGEKLLNDKAAHFVQFTRPLLHRLYVATTELEQQRLVKSGVPDNLRPVIIEATMDEDGQLTELVLQKLSGSGAVDKLMIQACKQGLWMRNPPPEARAADGTYRLRIEARIRNYMRPTVFSDWQLETHLGLALE